MTAPFPDFNVTSMVDVFVYVNIVTSPPGLHYFGDLIVACVWFIVWGVFSQSFRYADRPYIKGLIISSFTASVFSGMLSILSLVDRLMLALPFAMLCASIVADKLLEE